MSSMARSPAGMIQNAVSGTATRLATMPNVAMRWKWNAAKGVVATLAMSVVSITPRK